MMEARGGRILMWSAQGWGRRKLTRLKNRGEAKQEEGWWSNDRLKERIKVLTTTRYNHEKGNCPYKGDHGKETHMDVGETSAWTALVKTSIGPPTTVESAQFASWMVVQRSWKPHRPTLPHGQQQGKGRDSHNQGKGLRFAALEEDEGEDCGNGDELMLITYLETLTKGKKKVIDVGPMATSNRKGAEGESISSEETKVARGRLEGVEPSVCALGVGRQNGISMTWKQLLGDQTCRNIQGEMTGRHI